MLHSRLKRHNWVESLMISARYSNIWFAEEKHFIFVKTTEKRNSALGLDFFFGRSITFSFVLHVTCVHYSYSSGRREADLIRPCVLRRTSRLMLYYGGGALALSFLWGSSLEEFFFFFF